jgi:hypothetical protein
MNHETGQTSTGSGVNEAQSRTQKSKFKNFVQSAVAKLKRSLKKRPDAKR